MRTFLEALTGLSHGAFVGTTGNRIRLTQMRKALESRSTMRTFLADLAAIRGAKGHEWSRCPCCPVRCVRCGYRNLDE